MQHFSQYSTIAGTVTRVDPERKSFCVKCRSGDIFDVQVGTTTYFSVLTNLDNLGRDRVEEPAGLNRNQDWLAYDLQKYVHPDQFLFVEGVYQEHGERRRLEARTVHLLHHKHGSYLFEETHWWLVQISQMADRWLNELFNSTRSYKIDDFSRFYHTNLNIEGMPTNDNVQECATLARLIYGLSSAYLLTGAERYYLAAKAGVQYQREAFRSLSHDGHRCTWASGRRRNIDGTEQLIIASENEDDRGCIPLYEQIYALAGLTQYYRITLDWEVLEDIRRTINSFQAYFWDGPDAKAKGFPGLGGYFSHIDPATMRPDSRGLTTQWRDNRSRKNWNSIGDHIPAYLINLILALDPIPQGEGPSKRNLEAFLRVCRGILEETSDLIIDKFPDPACDYVNEKFLADWTPDHSWGWQQDRAVIGHNFKISWNLTRCAFYFQCLEKYHQDRGNIGKAKHYADRSERALDLARRLARRMTELGTDRIRGGIFDAVERHPSNEMPIQFAWGNTKDFWQQEQGILAYLILHGADDNDREFLDLARESMAFWNLFFLDRDRQGIFFRTTESGMPIIRGGYAQMGSHSVAGYHAFELNYLAHFYIRGHYQSQEIGDSNFCVYFKVSPSRDQESINVLPDFFPPGQLRICAIREDGVDVTEERLPEHPDFFQIAVPWRNYDVELAVEFTTTKECPETMPKGV